MNGMKTSFKLFTRNIIEWNISNNHTMLTTFEDFRNVVRNRFAKVGIYRVVLSPSGKSGIRIVLLSGQHIL